MEYIGAICTLEGLQPRKKCQGTGEEVAGQHLRSAEQACRLRRTVEGLPDGVVLDLWYVEGADDLHPVRRAGGAAVVALEGVAEERFHARRVQQRPFVCTNLALLSFGVCLAASIAPRDARPEQITNDARNPIVLTYASPTKCSMLSCPHGTC